MVIKAWDLQTHWTELWPGESGLDGVTLLPQPIAPAATDVNYLEAMYNALINTPPNTAWLISTGTLTNIGLVFQQYPDLASHIKGLSIMGGAVGGGFTNAPMGKVKGEGERFGNWTAFAEFNVSVHGSIGICKTLDAIMADSLQIYVSATKLLA
jgi:uridine nucleosidase